MTPTLTVTGDSFRRESALVGPAPDRTESAGHEVAGGTGGDEQRDVGLDRVEVLLDHREQVGIELAEGLQQEGHGRIPVRRLHHGTEHCSGRWIRYFAPTALSSRASRPKASMASSRASLPRCRPAKTVPPHTCRP